MSEDIFVNNKAVLAIPASLAEGKKITVNNGGKLFIYPDDGFDPDELRRRLEQADQ